MIKMVELKWLRIPVFQEFQESKFFSLQREEDEYVFMMHVLLMLILHFKPTKNSKKIK